jgi:hypothetical protein
MLILPRLIRCPHCHEGLELEEAERTYARFICPECGCAFDCRTDLDKAESCVASGVNLDQLESVLVRNGQPAINAGFVTNLMLMKEFDEVKSTGAKKANVGLGLVILGIGLGVVASFLPYSGGLSQLWVYPLALGGILLVRGFWKVLVGSLGNSYKIRE